MCVTNIGKTSFDSCAFARKSNSKELVQRERNFHKKRHLCQNSGSVLSKPKVLCKTNGASSHLQTEMGKIYNSCKTPFDGFENTLKRIKKVFQHGIELLHDLLQLPSQLRSCTRSCTNSCVAAHLQMSQPPLLMALNILSNVFRWYFSTESSIYMALLFCSCPRSCAAIQVQMTSGSCSRAN